MGVRWPIRATGQQAANRLWTPDFHTGRDSGQIGVFMKNSRAVEAEVVADVLRNALAIAACPADIASHDQPLAAQSVMLFGSGTVLLKRKSLTV